MKIITPGFAGRRAQCNLCKCVIELEEIDAKKSIKKRKPEDWLTFLQSRYVIQCPSCTYDIVLLEEWGHTPPPRGCSKPKNKTYFIEIGLLPKNEAAQKSAS